MLSISQLRTKPSTPGNLTMTSRLGSSSTRLVSLLPDIAVITSVSLYLLISTIQQRMSFEEDPQAIDTSVRNHPPGYGRPIQRLEQRPRWNPSVDSFGDAHSQFSATPESTLPQGQLHQRESKFL